VRPEEEPYGDAPPEIVQALGGRIPTEQQWQAISHPPTSCCVIAGAGSGKTAVIAARVVYLAMVEAGRLEAAHPGERPSRVLCLTFTNKAAEELARRVREATTKLGLPDGEEATVLTYHAFASQLLDDYGLRGGLEPGSMLLSEAQKWQLMSFLLADRTFEHLEVRTVWHVVRLALALSDECQNHLVEPERVIAESERLIATSEVKNAVDRDMLLAARRRIELAELVAAYRELRAIDYGDQIRLGVELARDRREVREEFRERFGAVLLDEYQDTNVAQGVLLRELCGGVIPVTAVGDPDQNIYAWRGASLHNILRFAQEFPEKDSPATRRPLYVNFRSGRRILAVADAVIGEVPPERRAEDKRLRADPARGEGAVLAFVAADERQEARRIAAMIREQLASRPPAEDGEPAWREVAILCRKRRLFARIAQVLREEDIPAEVVDLGGLLKMPEVVDVLAWLRILDDPGRNVALARILQGPRWRIGYRDLVALAQWSAANNRRLAHELPSDLERPGDVAFALGEALDHLHDEEMAGLTDEGRARLEEFRSVLAELREKARGPLADLVAEVVERSGLLRELEAAGTAAAVSARRNLLNLTDHVAAFAPVDGDASLATLVSYLDIAEEEGDELEPAQPSDANTVKLLTVHKAKGLEWPVVFVPGLAEHDRPGSSLLPDASRQPNPVTRAEALPFELRGDRDVLPEYRGNIKEFRQALSERGLEEERRLCYVALTRARDVLVVSSAYWYEGPADPFFPGRFFEEVAARAECEDRGREERPEENPLVDLRRVDAWPGPARMPDADDLFPEGWHRAAEEGAADPASLRQHAEELGMSTLMEFDRVLVADRDRAAMIRERTRPDPVHPWPTPRTLSVSSLIDYARCPKLFFWSQVRPLPRRSSRAARLGSEIHRWVELQSRGQTTLLDVDELPDLSIEERLADPGPEERLKETFRGSRFAAHTPLWTERPFLLFVEDVVVGGRIDAIFERTGGGWEVVDYKTGRRPREDDPLRSLQLDLYALACVEAWGKDPRDLVLTYFYLSSGEEVSRLAGDPAATRARVVNALGGIARGSFGPTPGDQCRWCDFLTFCGAGRDHVARLEQAVDRPATGDD
jgi:DNA helicase-2/ATP-dependent DNA helicase PcrA